MSEVGLKIYPSGFLGSASVKQTPEMAVADVAKQILNKTSIATTNRYTASLEVQAMWASILADAPEVKTFEFKEKILKIALSHFGDMNVLDWVSAQWMTEEYGSSHAKYLDETLKLVFGGIKRSMGTNAWSVILTAGRNDKGPRTFTPVMREYLLKDSFKMTRRNVPMGEIIVRWVRQPGGIMDLANSLQILYGTR
jgi:hypothetical protein